MTSRTTAIAEARPNLWYLNAILIVWMTNVSLPLAPPVMMNGISNTDSDPEIARMNDRPTIGRMPGSDDVPELLPPVGAVDLGRLVAVSRRDRLDRAQEQHEVQAEVAPHRDARRARS